MPPRFDGMGPQHHGGMDGPPRPDMPPRGNQPFGNPDGQRFGQGKTRSKDFTWAYTVSVPGYQFYNCRSSRC